MHESIARFVHPVFEHGLDLRRRIEAGKGASIDTEQLALEDLIRRDPGEFEGWRTLDPDGARSGAERVTTPRALEDIRYALTCWLDELFILDSPWNADWTDSKMEVRLFGSNERAWRFWERSASAELLPKADVLEVFYLCVALGFRGDLSEDPDRLKDWIDRTRQRLAVAGSKLEVAALVSPCQVPPLVGRDRLRRVSFLTCWLAIVSIPVLILILCV